MNGLPEGWAWSTVQELADGSFDGPFGSNLRTADYTTSGVLVARLENIGHLKYHREKKTFVSELKFSELSRHELLAGDILVGSFVADDVRVCVVPHDLGCRILNKADVFCLRLNSANCLPNYMAYRLASDDIHRNLSDSSVHGATRPRIGLRDLLGVPIEVPPVVEQWRIVAKIDSLSAKSSRARDHLDHISRLVEQYKQAILLAAFEGQLTRTWRDDTKIAAPKPMIVSDIAEVVTGFTPATKGRDRFFGGSIPFFKPTDLDAGYHVRTPRETLTEEGANAGRRVPAGSTLVTCIGATIGKTGFARLDCCTNQQINALIPRTDVVYPEWLFWMVLSPQFQEQIIGNSSATTLPIINKGRFIRLALPVPVIDEQREIVRCIETAFAWIDRLAAEATSARKLVDRLDQAVLAKAFQGELVPQDPADEPASALLDRIRAERAGAPKARRGRKRVGAPA